MRSVILFLYAFIGLSVAFPQFHILEARKGGQKNSNGTMKMGGGNSTQKSLNRQCAAMASLTMLTKLADNQTALNDLESKGRLNATGVSDLKAKAADAATKLATMTSNSTLVSECAVVDAHVKTLGDCKAMKKLTKISKLASNQTAMDAKITKMKLNDTEATAFKDMVSKAQTKLQTLESNTTLTDICSKETSQKGSNSSSSSSTGGTTQAGTAAGSSSGKTSAATALTLQSMPYVFVPALGAFVTLFL